AEVAANAQHVGKASGVADDQAGRHQAQANILAQPARLSAVPDSVGIQVGAESHDSDAEQKRADLQQADALGEVEADEAGEQPDGEDEEAGYQRGDGEASQPAGAEVGWRRRAAGAGSARGAHAGRPRRSTPSQLPPRMAATSASL